MSAPAVSYQRDVQTRRSACGVRLQPGHWASVTVHSFRTWTGEKTLTTWCGLEANQEDGARLTNDVISCLQCPQASLQAFRAP